jgi:hypothetical protein
LLDDESIKTLQCLGLTLNEARIYLALLDCDVSSAKTVSKFSGVTRQDVYRVMPKLQKKGLVARTLTMPAKFEATSIKDGLFILMENRRTKTNELKRKTTVLIKNIRDKKQKFQWGAEPEFVVVPAKEAFFRRKKMGMEAESCIDSIVTWNRFFSALSFYGDVALKDLEKGVRFRLIVEKNGDEGKLPRVWKKLKESTLLEVKYLPSLPRALVTIYDRKEVLFSISTASPLGGTCLWSSNASLLAIIQDYFELLWITAMETPYFSIDEE